MSVSVYDVWLKINVEINNKLKDLEKLEKEKNSLIEEAEKNLSEEVTVKMTQNIKEYERLLDEVKSLRFKAEKLKEKIN